MANKKTSKASKQAGDTHLFYLSDNQVTIDFINAQSNVNEGIRLAIEMFVEQYGNVDIQGSVPSGRDPKSPSDIIPFLEMANKLYSNKREKELVQEKVVKQPTEEREVQSVNTAKEQDSHPGNEISEETTEPVLEHANEGINDMPEGDVSEPIKPNRDFERKSEGQSLSHKDEETNGEIPDWMTE